MKKRHNIILVAVLILIVGAIFYLERPSTVTLNTGEKVDLGPIGELSKIEVGVQAPDFMLSGLDENKTDLHKLSDYRGKKVLLNFWASWCPFCVEEMPLFQELYDEFGAEGFEIIAINRGESAKKAKSFTDEMNLTYPLLLDVSDAVYAAYQGRSMPVSFMIDEQGVVLAIKFGPYDEAGLRKALKDYFNLAADSVKADGKANMNTNGTLEETLETVINGDSVSGREIMVTEGLKHSVPLKDIRGGGPPKDGIPSIDNPKFISVKEADEFLNDEGLGIALSVDGIDRFYPNQILVWHEIVNDQFGDQPALVTYCPLCGTGIVFEPIVKGIATEFGTSGKLWNSNLVMYDRQTDSYWSQVLGEAIVGELTGTKLKRLPYDNMLYGDWKKIYPKGQVLSKDTGVVRDYSRDPYGDYYTSTGIYFPVDYKDDRYHEKEPVWGIELDGKTKAYVLEELAKGPSEFTDTFAGVGLKISFDKKLNTIKIKKESDNTEVVPVYGFWFSWVSVHPDSEVWVAE